MELETIRELCVYWCNELAIGFLLEQENTSTCDVVGDSIWGTARFKWCHTT